MKKQEKQLTARIDSINLEFLTRYKLPVSAQLREDLEVLQGGLKTAEADLTGRFSPEQACLLCDLLNGHLFTPQFFASLPALLATEVEDGCRLDGLDKKWQVDARDLITACAALTPWEAYAVHHLARLFWTGPYRDSEIRPTVAKLFRCSSESPDH